MLSKYLLELISKSVSNTFDSLRLNLLGPEYFKGKTITIGYKSWAPTSNLVSNYLHAHNQSAIDPESIDKESIKKIISVADNYINALEIKSKADITRIVGEQHDNLKLKAKTSSKTIQELIKEDVGSDILKSLKNELKLQKERIDKSVVTLVNHELHNSQNIGALDGIIGMSKALGITDPTVMKLGVLDEKRCKFCWSLWTLPNKITPKVYKLSEIKGSPGNPKDPNASVAPTHISCRDILTTLMPGFGFDDSGSIVYKGDGWDEWSHQRK